MSCKKNKIICETCKCEYDDDGNYVVTCSNCDGDEKNITITCEECDCDDDGDKTELNLSNCNCGKNEVVNIHITCDKYEEDLN